jgi:AraC-like DNA-binding protein
LAATLGSVQRQIEQPSEDFVMDAETKIERADVRMDGTTYCAVRFDGAAVYAPPLATRSRCYFVRGGPLWVEIEGPWRSVIRLDPGAILSLSVMIPAKFHSVAQPKTPRRIDHRLLSEPATHPFQAELLFGETQIEILAHAGLWMGPILIPPDGGRTTRRIWRAVEGIEDELTDPIVGAEGQVQRMSEVILANIARWMIEKSPGEDSLSILAMGDVRILRAISAATMAPEEDWTLNDMARIAGMSRTAFCERFHQLTGQTPRQTLALLRLRLGAAWLAHSDSNVEQTANHVGYGSAAAFTRAFHRHFHKTPARWRQEMLAERPA